jgi:hypothetical protein
VDRLLLLGHKLERRSVGRLEHTLALVRSKVAEGVEEEGSKLEGVAHNTEAVEEHSKLRRSSLPDRIGAHSPLVASVGALSSLLSVLWPELIMRSLMGMQTWGGEGRQSLEFCLAARNWVLCKGC